MSRSSAVSSRETVGLGFMLGDSQAQSSPLTKHLERRTGRKVNLGSFEGRHIGKELVENISSQIRRKATEKSTWGFALSD